MNILRLAAEIFLLYILYKLIFDFIIPIYRTTKRVKKQFGEMNAKMQEQMNTYNQQQNAQGSASPREETVKKEDYIDYEEIK
ncbi:MAG TPA: hypothetical protein VMY77_13820 [Chitinophagaceae bacterium]|nr:hypothetical protein [Chitinophagaceae bacterium]